VCDVVVKGEAMSVHIEGRRWFQKSCGNTYNTVRIWEGPNLVVTLPETYGYGDDCLYRACDWLQHHGYPALTTGATLYLREVVEASYSVIDVSRERDL
jgi:hypothetical protein